MYMWPRTNVIRLNMLHHSAQYGLEPSIAAIMGAIASLGSVPVSATMKIGSTDQQQRTCWFVALQEDALSFMDKSHGVLHVLHQTKV